VTFEPAGYGGSRSAATAIYFLPHPGERSRWHPVRSDELWFWHSGGPLALRLGGDVGDVGRGEQPQALVPGGTWQAAEPAGEQPVLA
jgi:predicted cupin superfamily sugar epimerase